MIEFEVRHSAEGLRRVYRERWRHRFGRAHGISFSLAVVAFMAMLFLRSTPWPLVAAATLTLAYAALLTTLRDTEIRLALEHLAIMGDEPFRYRLDENSIRESTGVGDCELRWFVFDSVVRQGDTLMLMRRPRETQAFIALPLAQLPAETEGFIRERMARIDRADC